MFIVLYEDYYYKNFVPFYNFHPIFDLYYGYRKIFLKVFDLFRKNPEFKGLGFVGRPLQLKYFLKKYELPHDNFKNYDDVLFINARIKNINLVANLKKNSAIVDKFNQILALRVDSSLLKLITEENLFKHSIDSIILEKINYVDKSDVIEYAFDFIKYIEEEFIYDFERNYLWLKNNFKELKKNVFVHKEAEIKNLVEIDSDKGPVIIENNTIVNPLTAIFGPVYIGKRSLIDRAYIHENSVIGNICKISGEIEETYFSDYTNKHHTGFFGHSYLGEWVNIGALSTTSDLKNNYSNIRFEIGGKVVDSGTIKMGSLFGDHVKVSIGVMINCGTIIGEGSILFNNPEKKYIPPMRWGNQIYNKNKFIENAIKVMRRRKVKPDNCFYDIVERIYEKKD